MTGQQVRIVTPPVHGDRPFAAQIHDVDCDLIRLDRPHTFARLFPPSDGPDALADRASDACLHHLWRRPAEVHIAACVTTEAVS